jgi:hypothetical protein
MHTPTTGAHPQGDRQPKSTIFMAIQALCLVVAVYALWGAGVTAVYCLQGAPGRGTLHTDFSPAGDHQIVTQFEPGSPLAAAGIHVGDAVRFDHPVDSGGPWRAGETLGLTRLAPGQPGHLQVQVVPTVTDPASAEVERQAFIVAFLVDGCTTCFSVLMGVLLVIRARGSKALLALGFAFIVFDAYPPQTLGFDPQWRAFTAIAFQTVQGLFANIGFLLFVTFFYRENIGRVRPWAWLSIGLYLAVLIALWAAWNLDAVAGVYVNFGIDPQEAFGIWVPMAYALALVGLLVGWRRSRKDLQKRYALLCIAISLVIGADVIFTTLGIWVSSVDEGGLISYLAQTLSVAGHALFAYAVLRHRVIDLSFATNRVLVYGAVSSLLLVAFGLLEWAFEHFLPIEGREKNAFVDAGLALVVFLTFHRVRDFVEHHIEALFFHAWQRNEAKLRTFVTEAAFVTKPEALTAAFVAELQRFSGGASVTFYWQTAEGDYAPLGGSARRMDGDDAVLVTLRATGKSLEVDPTRPGWPVGLAIPVIMRADLMGFVALGAKPSGASYRPDEVEVLTWAVHQIGLDMHTRRVQQLEQANQVLEIKYNELKSVVAPNRGRSREPAQA